MRRRRGRSCGRKAGHRGEEGLSSVHGSIRSEKDWTLKWRGRMKRAFAYSERVGFAQVVIKTRTSPPRPEKTKGYRGADQLFGQRPPPNSPDRRCRAAR